MTGMYNARLEIEYERLPIPPPPGAPGGGAGVGATFPGTEKFFPTNQSSACNTTGSAESTRTKGIPPLISLKSGSQVQPIVPERMRSASKDDGGSKNGVGRVMSSRESVRILDRREYGESSSTSDARSSGVGVADVVADGVTDDEEEADGVLEGVSGDEGLVEGEAPNETEDEGVGVTDGVVELDAAGVRELESVSAGDFELDTVIEELRVEVELLVPEPVADELTVMELVAVELTVMVDVELPV